MKYDYRNANIYAASLHAFKVNILIVLLLAVGFVLLEWLAVGWASSFAKWVGPILFTAAFAYTIHATIIGNLDSGWKAFNTGGRSTNMFYLRTAKFLGFFFLLIFLFSIIATSVYSHPEVARGWAIILMGLIGLPLWGAIFALFGTMLPATSTARMPPSKPHSSGRKGCSGIRFCALSLGRFC